MLRKMKAILKPVVAPILERQWILERVKYFGTEVLGPQAGNDRIADLLKAPRPLGAGKFGGIELGALTHYLRHRDVAGECANWGRHAPLLQANAGVYPVDSGIFSRFCDEYSRALAGLDLLAVWFQPNENSMRRRFAPSASSISLTSLEPYFHQRPWSSALSGRRVLVISPFASTVQEQYARRVEVWRERPEVLPAFDLDTLRCPLSAGLVEPVFPDWFAALDAMKLEMSRRKFDVAIIGAGAWAIPLVNHAKSIGRSAIHLGGATQILFGIRGNRWDSHPIIRTFVNDAWVRPSGADRPENFRQIENGCYW